METKQLKRLPVGIQTFSDIIENGMLYVDKTEHLCYNTFKPQFPLASS